LDSKDEFTRFPLNFFFLLFLPLLGQPLPQNQSNNLSLLSLTSQMIAKSLFLSYHDRHHHLLPANILSDLFIIDLLIVCIGKEEREIKNKSKKRKRK
jgi:hypothetical protein